MERLMIRYTVKNEELEHHLELIQGVYDELHARRPTDLRFATFHLELANSFVDIALGADLPGPLPAMASFQRYRTDLESRCEKRIATELHIVGSYRF